MVTSTRIENQSKMYNTTKMKNSSHRNGLFSFFPLAIANFEINYRWRQSFAAKSPTVASTDYFDEGLCAFFQLFLSRETRGIAPCKKDQFLVTDFCCSLFRSVYEKIVLNAKILLLIFQAHFCQIAG